MVTQRVEVVRSSVLEFTLYDEDLIRVTVDSSSTEGEVYRDRGVLSVEGIGSSRS